MKLFVFAFAALAVTSATTISNEYLAPLESNNLSQEYLPPTVVEELPTLADDGYRYKTVRKTVRHRHRRDVSELPSGEYLPPAQEYQATEQVVSYAAPVEVAAAASDESSVLANDGYRYKTVRRLRHRRRRDVNELPSNEYLPPTQEVQATEQVVAVEAPAAAASEESAVLADDGYRYKTVRRIRYRRRRDVNELPSNEYLPPTQEVQATEQVVAVEAPAAAASEESAVLADDGYRYKTVRRIRYRRRRDVNELPSNEYLPPTQEVQATEQVVAVEAPAAAASEESAVLADDGYRYKTVRRIRYRRRRDVNELPSGEYLPPAPQEYQATEQVISYAAPVEVAAASDESAVLANDGYRYKTVRRLRHRQRRDVNELPSNEYLPPTQEYQATEQVVSYAAPVEVAAASDESAVLANDGYRYKTVRRLRHRQRRDVNELPSNEYLPPTQEYQATEQVVSYAAPVEVAAASDESAVLANDGYRYKTVRRLRHRRRRDVNELPSGEYLPPAPQEYQATEQVISYAAPVEVAAASEESSVLANDGYRYKTVRRLRHRHRRDVNEQPSNEYLPPTTEYQQESQDVFSVAPSFQETAVLSNDGYRYKTVRRLRHRRH